MTNQTTGQHTPGKLVYSNDGKGGFILNTAGLIICTMNHYCKDSASHAAFIVRACNSHDALVGALKALFEHCAMVHKYWGDGSNAKEADAAIKSARAAIAAATKET